MKPTTYQQGGMKVAVHADRAPNLSKNLRHGNNTLIGAVPAGLTLAIGRGRYHGAACEYCQSWSACKPEGARADQDYCFFYPARFQCKAMR